MSFEPYTLLAGFIFGTIGFGLLTYGRRLQLWKPQVIGLAMGLYPYLVTNRWAVWLIGIALMVVAWFHHDE